MTDDILRQAEAFEQLERLEENDETLDLELLADGRIRAQKAAARDLLRDRLRSAEVLPTGPGWAVLRSRAPAPPRELLGRAREVVAAGLVGSFGWSVIDIIGLVASCHQTGVLSVRSEARRCVYFFEGEVVWASSTAPSDRLGPFLLARGKITRDQLHAALRDGPAGIGRASVERGYISHKELEPIFREFIAERFGALVAMETGLWSFARLADEPLREAPLREPAPALLMESLRRQDEMRIYRQRVRHPEVLVRRIGKHTGEILVSMRDQLENQAPALIEDAEPILRALSGAASIHELMRRTGRGEFEVTRTVYHLLRTNVVTLVASRRKSRPASARFDPREIISIYELALAEMMNELRRTGRASEMLDAVNGFLGEEGGAYRELLADLRLDPEGRFSTAALLTRFEGSPAGSEELIDALGELLFFGLMRASEILGRRRGDDLARRVRMIHGMLRRGEEFA